MASNVGGGSEGGAQRVNDGEAESLSHTQPLNPDERPVVHFTSKVRVVNMEPGISNAHSEDPSVSPQLSREDTLSPINLRKKDSRVGLWDNPEQESARLAQRRMSLFDYQPLSLPASRVQSREQQTPPTDTPKSRQPSMHSPPLTPAATRSHEGRDGVIPSHLSLPKLTAQDPAAMTPQASPPPRSMATTRSEETNRQGTSSEPTTRPSSAYGMAGQRRESGPVGHGAKFDIGPSQSGSSQSRGESPSRAYSGSGPQTPAFPPSRPFTPIGDKDDPYARSKRPPPSRSTDDIEDRFKFSGRSSHHLHHHPHSSKSSVANIADPKESKQHHSHMSLGFGKGHQEEEKKGSMADLKRYFRGSSKRSKSPAPSIPTSRPLSSHSNSKLATEVPFADESGLARKYGKFGRILGSGAGGSVRLMKRPTDGVIFAVKEFRPRHTYETEKEYAKKVTAEFCIGSTLHHGNIIETLDVVNEKGKWYEVMEYGPYDLFAIVMSGKMTKPEVACCFIQLLNGVSYLHGMGLAHRDLKLDNVVVNDHGILKIIDFGSAAVFRYPFENDIVLAHGVVGSDPYLAPEVLHDLRYDPQPADIWSLAIIFCCMSLRRFPWKAPRQSDNSFKLFSAPPSTTVLDASGRQVSFTPGMPALHHHERDRHHTHDKSSASLKEDAKDSASNVSTGVYGLVPNGVEPKPHETVVIRGPWRLLRLLPRESRGIVGRMLDLNPKSRATLSQIWEDPWIVDTQVCYQDDANIVNAPGHVHNLVPGDGGIAPGASRKGSK